MTVIHADSGIADTLPRSDLAFSREDLAEGRTALGIEFGSTRIKAVLIAADGTPVASGGHEWENRLVDGVWTYDLDAVWAGLRDAYADLARDVAETHGLTLTTVGAIGVSAMMHGYLAFDADDELLVPFRTWRNTSTGAASTQLTDLFGMTVPQRWSIAHLHQAVLDQEEHVARIASLDTLSGLVHRRLTGRHVLGVGDASGMFPIDSRTCDYDQELVDRYERLIGDRRLPWHLRDLLPVVLSAGEDAGTLTPEGAALLDPTGRLRPGIPLAPPEGDAGTGMVATHAVAPRTGNVSVGTSVFAMLVLERPLARLHPELDPVCTPDGHPVAMVHANNGTGELDSWVRVFEEFSALMGIDADRPRLYDALYAHALEGDADGGGLLPYNLLSGEPVVGLEEGRPLLVRAPSARLTLANFVRSQIFTVFGALRLGMDLLSDEGVRVDRLVAHGGLFKTPDVGQRLLAAALDTPVAVGASAGEGGAWGMALLARYRVDRRADETLASYLADRVFAQREFSVAAPDPADRAGFDAFIARYREGLGIEQAAIRHC